MESNENNAIEPGPLLDESQERKERLKKLKSPLDNGNQSNNIKDALKLLPKFKRNKEDEKLNALFALNPQPDDIIAEIEDQSKARETIFTVKQSDLNTSAPRKPDWKLKKDIEKRMAMLEGRTNRAIAEMVYEKLKEENN